MASVAAVRPQDSVVLKINHNEFLSYLNTFDQPLFASVKQAFDMGMASCHHHFGPAESAPDRRNLPRLPAGPRARHVYHSACDGNNAFKVAGKDYHASADSPAVVTTSVTIAADIITKLPPTTAATISSKDNPAGKDSDKIHTDLCSDSPIDLTPTVANRYGPLRLINPAATQAPAISRKPSPPRSSTAPAAWA